MTNIPSALGATVKTLRIQQGLTHATLAARAGVGAGLISALETGRARVIQPEQLAGLERGLGLSEGDLRRCLPEPHAATRWMRVV